MGGAWANIPAGVSGRKESKQEKQLPHSHAGRVGSDGRSDPTTWTDPATAARSRRRGSIAAGTTLESLEKPRNVQQLNS